MTNMTWIKGIIASALTLGIIGLLINVYINYGWVSALVSTVCMIFAIFSILSLIYAIEENNFFKGFLVPILFVLAGITGYYGKAPIEETIVLCILGSILALIIASTEGD